MKTALIALGLYCASVALWLVLLVVGAIAAGKSHSGAETAMLFIFAGELLALVGSAVVVLRRMKHEGVTVGARLLAGLAWSGLSAATLAAMFVMTALAFNR